MEYTNIKIVVIRFLCMAARRAGDDVDDIPAEMARVYHAARKKKRGRYDRVLPFGEYVVDRWEKAEFVGAGEGSSIYDMSYIFGDVSIGRDTWIGMYTILDGSGARLSIGNNCAIGVGVHIYTHSSLNWTLTGGKVGFESAPVKIGDSCYISPKSMITMGVEIGERSVIGANSLVKSDMPPNSVAFGSPAKVVGRVEVDGEKVNIEYF